METNEKETKRKDIEDKIVQSELKVVRLIGNRSVESSRRTLIKRKKKKTHRKEKGSLENVQAV